MQKWQENLTGAIYASLIAIAITIFSFFEAFTLVNEWIYNFLNPNLQAAKVLLVEAEADKQADWLKLLEILEQKKAKQVVFTFMPKKVPNAFYCRAQRYGNVFFARSFNAHGLEALPTNCKINFGLVGMPPHRHGIHREQYSNFQIGAQNYPALEVVAALHFLGNPLNLADTRYHIDFGRGLDHLPKLRLEKIMSGGLVSDLVEQRSVVIGLAQPNNLPGLYTPSQDVMISMFEYHALALNTLLTDGQFIIFDIKMLFLLLLAIMLVNFVIYPKFHKILQFTLIIVAVEFVLAWLLYYFFSIWLPLIEMMMAQGVWYWLYLKNQIITADVGLREKLMDKSFKLEKRANSGYFATDEYWSQVIVMLYEVLDLSRLIVLGWRLDEVQQIKALYCSSADIEIWHHQQEPYATAIREKCALNRALLKPTDKAEEQYMIPLFFGDELQGFWILAIETAKLQNKNHFEASITDFAIQLGESLYHRQRWLLRNQVSRGLLHRYFHFKSGDLLYKTLDKSIAALEQQLSVLKNIMDELETAIILYDVFGTAIQVNQSMKALSQTFGLRPENMTALGFLMEVSNMDMKTARQYFRHIFLAQGNIVRQVSLSKSIERDFVLNMQLFSYQYTVEDTDNKVKQGILCQLVDVTQIKLRSTLKEQVAERLIFQCRNDMQSILMASKILSNDQLNETTKRSAANTLQNKVNNHITILNDVEKWLNVQMDTTKPTLIETYPIDAKEPLLDATERSAKLAVKRHVKLQNNLPALVSLVFASHNELTSVISSLLVLLIDDAIEETQITISMEERDNWMTYTFQNVGFGIPDERLQQYLFDDEIKVSEKFENIRRAISMINVWEGTLKAESQVGQGLYFELRLRSFI